MSLLTHTNRLIHKMRRLMHLFGKDSPLTQVCKDIIDVFNQINNDSFRAELRMKSKLGDNEAYGLTNEYEMLAEMSNPVFRVALKAKKLWRQLINGIRRILQFDVIGDDEGAVDAYTVLNDALNTIMDNFDARSYRQYVAFPMLKEFSKEVEDDGGAKFRDGDVREKIADLFMQAVSGKLKGKPVSIGRLTQAGKEYHEQMSGLKFKDYVDFVLNPSDLAHIYKRHFGDNEKGGRNIPLEIEDIKNLSDIIYQPDRIIYTKEEKGLERKMFSFLKGAERGSYNLL